jgi:hypothetical protein
VTFFATPENVHKVVEACERAFARGEFIGLDTEFYNVEVGEESCYGTAKLHLWSIAVARYPTAFTPRGYPVTDAAVGLADCLPALRGVLEGPGAKVVHNLPVDAHTLRNAGITLNGGINSLASARWAWPERARGAGFTLDSLGTDLLGLGKTESFRELFSEEVTEYRSTFRKTQRCECGMEKCGRRRTTPGHARTEEMVETRHPKQVIRPVPLESVVPGHRLWLRALEYAAQDAVMAHAVHWLALEKMRKTPREIPWLVTSHKPALDYTAPRV